MEEVRSSENSVNFYQNTLRHIPEDSLPETSLSIRRKLSTHLHGRKVLCAERDLRCGDFGSHRIVTCRLNAGISKSKQTSIASQRLGKHCSRTEVCHCQVTIGYTRCKQIHGCRYGNHGNYSYNGSRHTAIWKSRMEPFEAVSAITAA
jgi:hypothetical protein